MSTQGANYFRQGDQALVLGGKVELLPGVDVIHPERIWGTDDANLFVRYTRVALTAATGTGAGAVLAWANPYGKPIVVVRPIIRIVTASSGSATIDVGVAANGTTASNNLFDGLDVNASTGLFEAPQGTNGAALREMSSAQFITGTASATLAGLVASIIIPHIVIE